MGNEDVTNDSAKENQEKKNQAANALDELLTDPDVKEEFDARIQEAVNAALAEADTGVEDVPDDLEEIPQNEETKTDTAAVAEDDARTKELEEREKNLMARELKAAAIEELGKEQLPTELAECFNYESEETYKNSKESVVKAFQNALKASVNSRLRGTKTPGVASNDFKGAGGKSRTTSFASIVKGQNSRR